MQYLGLAYIALWIAGVIGWCLNILKLIEALQGVAPSGVLEIIRAIGVFAAPLGSVLGLFV